MEIAIPLLALGGMYVVSNQNSKTQNKSQKKQENYTNDSRIYYRKEYLKSLHWKELKSRKLKLVKMCENVVRQNV